jgi:hypothetical protein
MQPAAAQVTVVTTQPVVVQKPVFRDYPVVVTLENGQQVSMGGGGRQVDACTSRYRQTTA